MYPVRSKAMNLKRRKEQLYRKYKIRYPEEKP